MSKRRITYYTKKKENEWLEQLNIIIKESIDKDYLTNPFIANQMAISERQLSRNIRRITGLSILQYVRKVKMEVAWELLYSEDYLSIKELAYAVGYKKVNYFSEIFEETFGKRPSDILREL